MRAASVSAWACECVYLHAPETHSAKGSLWPLDAVAVFTWWGGRSRGLTDKCEANAFRSILSWERVSGVEEREWKVVRGEGGAREGLINHSCIVIDFLLQGVSQTLNYVFFPTCLCMCGDVYLLYSAQSHQLRSHTSQRFGTVASLIVIQLPFSFFHRA